MMTRDLKIKKFIVITILILCTRYIVKFYVHFHDLVTP